MSPTPTRILGDRCEYDAGRRVTAVLVFGNLPPTGHVRGSGAERVVVGAGEGAVLPHAVLDLVRHRLETAGHVVTLYPAWQPEPALHALRLAHVALATERFVLVPCSLPPLAMSLVADQIGYLAPYCPPGALVALVSALGRVTLSGAWLGSVAGLENVHTSLTHHMASYMPGCRFVVTASPRPHVHRITGSASLGELPFRPADPVHVITGGTEGGDTEWLRRSLLPAVRAQHVRPVPPPPLGEAYWGTKKYVEFVAISGHPNALPVIANSIHCRPCPWCGEQVATPTCPMCSMVSPHEAATEAGPPAQHRPAPAPPAAHQRPPQPPSPAQPSPPPRTPGQPGAASDSSERDAVGNDGAWNQRGPEGVHKPQPDDYPTQTRNGAP